jgi:hypothetical protein
MQPNRIHVGFDVNDRHPADRGRCLGVAAVTLTSTAADCRRNSTPPHWISSPE